MRLPDFSQSVERKTTAAARRNGINPQVHPGCASPVPGATSLQQTRYRPSSHERWTTATMVDYPFCYSDEFGWHVCTLDEIWAPLLDQFD
jgi:hypothetical protein